MVTELNRPGQQWSPKDITKRLLIEQNHKTERKTELDPEASTLYMATPTEESWAPTISLFKPMEEFKKAVAREVVVAPRNKVTGTDEVFMEALEFDPKTTNTIVYTLCSHC